MGVCGEFLVPDNNISSIYASFLRLNRYHHWPSVLDCSESGTRPRGMEIQIRIAVGEPDVISPDLRIDQYRRSEFESEYSVVVSCR